MSFKRPRMQVKTHYNQWSQWELTDFQMRTLSFWKPIRLAVLSIRKVIFLGQWPDWNLSTSSNSDSKRRWMRSWACIRKPKTKRNKKRRSKVSQIRMMRKLNNKLWKLQSELMPSSGEQQPLKRSKMKSKTQWVSKNLTSSKTKTKASLQPKESNSLSKTNSCWTNKSKNKKVRRLQQKILRDQAINWRNLKEAVANPC